MNNIKRDKKIITYLKNEAARLGQNISMFEIFDNYIAENLNNSDILHNYNLLIQDATSYKILENDDILIEILKLIGIMEVADNIKELDKLLEKKKLRKGKKEELNDFDKILKNIMKVPNKKEKPSK